MANSPDVYREWLGIERPTPPPLTHYELLRLPPFEDDVAVIRTRCRQAIAEVHSRDPKRQDPEARSLRDELTRAMLCLTDVRRKGEYDSALGRAGDRSGADRSSQSLEEILIRRKVVDEVRLREVRRFAQSAGLELRDALLGRHFAPADLVMQAYAESLGAPYVDLDETGLDESLISLAPPQLARRHACIPLMVDAGRLYVASADPLQPHVEDDFRLRSGMPVHNALATPAGIHEQLERYYPRESPSDCRASSLDAARGEPTPNDSHRDSLKKVGLLGRLFGG